MPHIHDKIDFATAVYVVFKDKVLFIHHKELNKWLPLGGHIELDEDPEQAAIREVKEESGLDVTIIGDKPDFVQEGVQSLYPPTFLNVHKISDSHSHIGFVYLATSKTDKIVLAEREHHDIRWLSREDLGKSEYNLQEDVRIYALEALKKLGDRI